MTPSELAATQGGLVTRTQLARIGVDRFRVRNQIAAGRWVERSPTVIGTTTGELSRGQSMWLGVLHAGPRALIGDLTAAEVAGLQRWHRDEIVVLVPADAKLDGGIEGIRFARTRRPIALWRVHGLTLPSAMLEPAILHFAAYQPSLRTAQGVLAAAVQQRLTTPERLGVWVRRMRPLRWAKPMRATLDDLAGGAQSVAEIDVRRLCRDHGLVPPRRQTRRTDLRGARRYTDCEWRLADGRTLVLEVDGAFHMDVEHWEDDLIRHRRLSTSDVVIVRCTASELRRDPETVANDLRTLGVPSRGSQRAS